jgi:UTP--glucose-1-phosphate uridylyltransferase
VLACIKAKNEEDYKKYGFVGGKEEEPGLISMNKVIEKPGSSEASPSNIATVSGYIFEPTIFEYLRNELKNLKPGQELWVPPAIQKMMDEGRDVWGLEIKNGKFYDTGNKMEYLKTVIDFALEREDLGDGLRNYLNEKLSE